MKVQYASDLHLQFHVLYKRMIRQPIQHLAKAKHDRLDRFWMNLHKVDVLTVSRLRLQKQRRYVRMSPHRSF